MHQEFAVTDHPDWTQIDISKWKAITQQRLQIFDGDEAPSKAERKALLQVLDKIKRFEKADMVPMMYAHNFGGHVYVTSAERLSTKFH